MARDFPSVGPVLIRRHQKLFYVQYPCLQIVGKIFRPVGQRAIESNSEERFRLRAKNLAIKGRFFIKGNIPVQMADSVT
jgi:hypothetical protein